MSKAQPSRVYSRRHRSQDLAVNLNLDCVSPLNLSKSCIICLGIELRVLHVEPARYAFCRNLEQDTRTMRRVANIAPLETSLEMSEAATGKGPLKYTAI